LTLLSDPALKSYGKTGLVCLAFALVGALIALFGHFEIAGAAGALLAGVGLVIFFAALALTAASAVVLARHVHDKHGGPDWFLHFNRSREPMAIEAAAPRHSGRLRRWLARRLLGHDFLVGDIVEIRPWPEIRATLDERGLLDELPFMPEMLAMCGQRAVVFRCMHRLFDYRKSRRMRHMDGAVLLVRAVCNGAQHGHCEASCHTIWKTQWLRQVPPGVAGTTPAPSDGARDNTAGIAAPKRNAASQAYFCQLTQLHEASRPVRRRSAAEVLMPLVSGNVALPAYILGWLTHIFNNVQHRRQGVGYPALELITAEAATGDEEPIRAGDHARVRSAAQIRGTLNSQFMHRGLWFEPDMLKYCGRCYPVQAEVRNLIDIVTGEMLTMKTPAYILKGVHFSGERQMFNSQFEPLFWRSVWLKRDEAAASHAAVPNRSRSDRPAAM